MIFNGANRKVYDCHLLSIIIDGPIEILMQKKKLVENIPPRLSGNEKNTISPYLHCMLFGNFLNDGHKIQLICALYSESHSVSENTYVDLDFDGFRWN